MKTDTIKRFCLLQLLVWGAWASFGPFYTYYLMDLGYTSADLGLALSLFTFMGVIGQYFFGLICDIKRTIKKIYLVIIGLTSLFVLAFSIFADNKILVFGVIAMIGFSWLPKSSLLDSWILGSDGIDQKDYGKFRCFGSLGAAIIASVFGKIIGLYGNKMMIIVFIGLSMIEGFVIWSTKDIYVEHEKAEKIHPIKLFNNKLYVLIIFFAIFVGTGKYMILNFYPFIFRSVGGNEFHMGLATGITAFIEIPFFIISGKLIKKFNPMRILLACAMIYFLRIILTWAAVSPIQLIIIGLLQAIGFSFIMSTGRILINMIAPPSLKTTAQGIFLAAFSSVSGIIASLLGGYLINKVGMDSYYLVASVFVLCGVILMMGINILSNERYSDKIKSI